MGHRIAQTSELACSAETAWAHATDMNGVNSELLPWLRMTVPAAARGKTIADVPLGEVAFHSWLLAFGFLPFDRHALLVVEIEPGRRFLEASSSWAQKHWGHERIIEPIEGGCRVTDRITFQPRLSFVAPLAARIVAALFAHRHRRLQQKFGVASKEKRVDR